MLLCAVPSHSFIQLIKEIAVSCAQKNKKNMCDQSLQIESCLTHFKYVRFGIFCIKLKPRSCLCAIGMHKSLLWFIYNVCVFGAFFIYTNAHHYDINKYANNIKRSIKERAFDAAQHQTIATMKRWRWRRPHICNGMPSMCDDLHRAQYQHICSLFGRAHKIYKLLHSRRYQDEHFFRVMWLYRYRTILYALDACKGLHDYICIYKKVYSRIVYWMVCFICHLSAIKTIISN